MLMLIPLPAVPVMPFSLNCGVLAGTLGSSLPPTAGLGLLDSAAAALRVTAGGGTFDGLGDG